MCAINKYLLLVVNELRNQIIIVVKAKICPLITGWGIVQYGKPSIQHGWIPTTLRKFCIIATLNDKEQGSLTGELLSFRDLGTVEEIVANDDDATVISI